MFLSNTSQNIAGSGNFRRREFNREQSLFTSASEDGRLCQWKLTRENMLSRLAFCYLARHGFVGYSDVRESFPTPGGVRRSCDSQLTFASHRWNKRSSGIPWCSANLVVDVFAFRIIVVVITGEQRFLSISSILQNRQRGQHEPHNTQEGLRRVNRTRTG